MCTDDCIRLKLNRTLIWPLGSEFCKCTSEVHFPTSAGLLFTVKSNVALTLCEIVPDTLGTMAATLNLIGSNTADMLLYGQKQISLNKQAGYFCSV